MPRQRLKKKSSTNLPNFNPTREESDAQRKIEERAQRERWGVIPTPPWLMRREAWKTRQEERNQMKKTLISFGATEKQAEKNVDEILKKLKKQAQTNFESIIRITKKK